MERLTVHGVEVPRIGLGTWNLRGQTCRQAVARALALGYRHIDTAELYGNEQDIGAAVGAAGVPRTELFIVSKAWSDHLHSDSLVAACEASLERLGTDYMDLYLVHWPNRQVPIDDTMAGMGKLLQQGKTRQMGVSNFSIQQMEEAETALGSRIFCNQVRFNVRHRQPDMVEHCQRQDVLLAAYTPLAKGAFAGDPVLVEIGKAHGKTPHQVALRWLIQQDNVAALPKSARQDHQEQNLDVFDFSLSTDEMARIGFVSG